MKFNKVTLFGAVAFATIGLVGCSSTTTTRPVKEDVKVEQSQTVETPEKRSRIDELLSNPDLTDGQRTALERALITSMIDTTGKRVKGLLEPESERYKERAEDFKKAIEPFFENYIDQVEIINRAVGEGSDFEINRYLEEKGYTGGSSGWQGALELGAIWTNIHAQENYPKIKIVDTSSDFERTGLYDLYKIVKEYGADIDLENLEISTVNGIVFKTVNGNDTKYFVFQYNENEDCYQFKNYHSSNRG